MTFDLSGYPEHLTAREVGEILRIDPKTVVRKCGRGQIPGASRPFGGQWLIHRDTFAAGLNSQRPR